MLLKLTTSRGKRARERTLVSGDDIDSNSSALKLKAYVRVCVQVRTRLLILVLSTIIVRLQQVSRTRASRIIVCDALQSAMSPTGPSRVYPSVSSRPYVRRFPWPWGGLRNHLVSAQVRASQVYTRAHQVFQCTCAAYALRICPSNHRLGTKTSTFPLSPRVG